jgi:hypothetical protein
VSRQSFSTEAPTYGATSSRTAHLTTVVEPHDREASLARERDDTPAHRAVARQWQQRADVGRVAHRHERADPYAAHRDHHR